MEENKKEVPVRTKTLLIGCGGSGIKTLTRLNELLASNANFREDMAETISYFALDTDQNDLVTFTEDIEFQMGSTASPVIRTLPLLENYHRLSQITDPTFGRFAKDAELTDLLKKYWWYHDAKGPFRGEHLPDLQGAGAAQCCQVSYLGAWNAMSRIKEELDSLLDEISAQNQNDPRPLANLKVYIVAGLAGGTGRGCWTLIAFKIRQCLLERGLTVPIDAVFFDATCYPNVLKKDEEQKKNMCVNSATGISELSAWIRLKTLPVTDESFFLPSLANPRPDHTSDAINFDKFGITDRDYLAPVQSAFVVFGGNGSTAGLRKNDDYHKMAAAALYASIVNAGQIGTKAVNMRSNIGSFASTTFEVDSYRIQTYMETRVQMAFLEKQCAEDPALAAKVAADVAGGEKSYLKVNKLGIPSPLTFDNSTSSLDETDSLLGAMMTAFGEVPGTGLKTIENKEQHVEELALTKGLREKLQSQNVEEVFKWIRAAFSLPQLKEDVVRQCRDRILGESGLVGENLTQALCSLILKKLAPEDNEPVSLRRAMLWAEKLKEEFAACSAALSGPVTLPCKISGELSDGDAAKKALVAAFKKEVEDRAGREYYVVGAKFNEREIAELCKKVQHFIHAAVFFTMKDALKAFYDEAGEKLAVIEKGLKAMARIFDRAGNVLKKDFEREFGTQNSAAIFAELFTDSKSTAAIRNALPQTTDLGNLYRRQLKPILDESQLQDLLTKEDNFSVDTESVRARIGQEFADLLDVYCQAESRTYRYEDDAFDEAPAKIAQTVRESVHLNVGVVNQEFSFERVLDDNIKVWNGKLLDKAQGRDLGNLQDQFKNYLGLEKSEFGTNSENGGRQNRLVKKSVIFAMIRNLVTVCNPWMVLRPDPSQTDVLQPLSCLVVLPFKLEPEQQKALETVITGAFKDQKYALTIDFLSPDPGRPSLNIPKDRILVYTSELLGYGDNVEGAPVEKILSLDYWNDYAETLAVAEDPEHNGAALFEWVERHNCWAESVRSYAFLAPFFTLPPYNGLRWRPWFKEDVNLEKAKLDEICKVLFYALLGHGPKSGKDAEDRPVAAIEAAKQYDCQLPLLEMGKGTRPECFYFCREQRKWKGNRMVEVIDTAWAAGSELENSINHVVEFLSGEGHAAYRSEKGKKLEESIVEGEKIFRALLSEAEPFLENMPSTVGATLYKELVKQCCYWIREQKEKSSAEDKRYWEGLFEFANAYWETLG